MIKKSAPVGKTGIPFKITVRRKLQVGEVVLTNWVDSEPSVMVVTQVGKYSNQGSGTSYRGLYQLGVGTTKRTVHEQGFEADQVIKTFEYEGENIFDFIAYVLTPPMSEAPWDLPPLRLLRIGTV